MYDVMLMHVTDPTDPIALDMTTQYLIGDQLLVAPVIGKRSEGGAAHRTP